MTDGMPSQTLDLSDVVRRDAKMMSADVHDETVLLDVDSGACFGFDRVGSRIWALIEQPQRVEALCAALLDEFDIDEPTCRAEVLGFLENLRTDGLIQVVAKP